MILNKEECFLLFGVLKQFVAMACFLAVFALIQLSAASQMAQTEDRV